MKKLWNIIQLYHHTNALEQNITYPVQSMWVPSHLHHQTLQNLAISMTQIQKEQSQHLVWPFVYIWIVKNRYFSIQQAKAFFRYA